MGIPAHMQEGPALSSGEVLLRQSLSTPSSPMYEVTVAPNNEMVALDLPDSKCTKPPASAIAVDGKETVAGGIRVKRSA